MPKKIIALLALSSLAISSAALSQTPSAVSDLVGARAAGGETELISRGYVNVKTQKGDDRAWSYWWHEGRNECITVAVLNGRYDAITSTPAPDCDRPAQRATRTKGSTQKRAATVKLNDLLTMRAASADVELQQRGFRTVKAYQAGESAYTIRSNDRTGQCVQVAVTDGRVRYISPLKARSCR